MKVQTRKQKSPYASYNYFQVAARVPFTPEMIEGVKQKGLEDGFIEDLENLRVQLFKFKGLFICRVIKHD